MELANIFGSTQLIAWEEIVASHQTKISQAVVPGTKVNYLVYPNNESELAEVMNCAYANHWGVLPCGSGSKLNWGGLVNKVNLVTSTTHLNRLIEHAVGDLTVTVEAGMKFSDLQATLSQARQFLAIDPAYPDEATIGGIVATGDTGSLRQRYGSVRDMILGISFVRADGEVAKAGGRVVKNVAGYDLMKLLTGSFGTLGIISQVTFRVYPMPDASATVVFSGTATLLAQAAKTLLTSALTPTAVDLLSQQMVSYLGLGSQMGLVARFQSVSAGVKEQSERLLEVGKHLGLDSCLYTNDEEVELWKKLSFPIGAIAKDALIICKIGVLPAASVTILEQLDALFPQSALGLIHAGKGLGVLQIDNTALESGQLITALQKMRSLCQTHGGFLSILEAPTLLKQQMDVWGYIGNALDLMGRIKKQFDQKNILSPHRFVGGI